MPGKAKFPRLFLYLVIMTIYYNSLAETTAENVEADILNKPIQIPLVSDSDSKEDKENDSFRDMLEVEDIKDGSSKHRGQLCNPDTLRPCPLSNDVCKGNPPKCTKNKLIKTINALTDLDNSKQVSIELSELNSKNVIKFDINAEVFEEIQPANRYKREKSKPSDSEKISKVKRTTKRSKKLSRKDEEGRPTINPAEINHNADPDIALAPPFKGSLSWAGGDDSDKDCVLNFEIHKETFSAESTKEEKDQWFKENGNLTCDYDKFQVCVEKEDEIKDLESEEEKEKDTFKLGYCRCIEIHYSIVDSKCHIPANFGSFSNCGGKKTIYKPVPGLNDSHPIQGPSCTPNAGCVSSPEYFGNRCRCKEGFLLVNHTCNSAINLILRNDYLVANLVISILAWLSTLFVSSGLSNINK